MTTQIQKANGGKPEAPIQTLKRELVRLMPAILEIVPRHVDAERLTKVVVSAANRTPALLECSMPSIVRSVMQAAELGLELGGLLGEAYLVPFNRSFKDASGRWQKVKEAQCITGYRGLIKLSRQSGQIASIAAHPIFEGERYEIDLASNHIVHRVDLTAKRGEMIGVYALAIFSGGEKQLEVMTRGDVELIRSRSKASEDGPWKTDYLEMARKTVVRRLCKYLPLSPQLATQLGREDEAEGRDRPVIDVDLVAEALKEEPKAKQLAGKIRASKAAAGSAPSEPSQPEDPPASEEGESEEEPPLEEPPPGAGDAWEGSS